MRAHLFLQLKKHKECIEELINLRNSAFVPLILRLAHNYKLLDTNEVKQYIQSIVNNLDLSKDKRIVALVLESLISIGQHDLAEKLIVKCDIETMKNDKQVMSLYVNLMAEKDLEKASKLIKDMDMPLPSDTFDANIIQEKGLTEEDCINQLIEAAMPEKTKELKIEGGGNIQVSKGGAEIFIPKKKINKKVRYPKDYDPTKMPDPERWLPKW